MNELDLSLQLEMFVQASQKTRERALPHLLRSIQNNITPQTIDQLLEAKITALYPVSQVLEATFAELPGELGRRIYTGEGSAVIVSADGKILGWYENSDGPVHQEHGMGEDKSLLTYAMIKCVRRLHLELIADSKYKGGIVNRNNWDYLRSFSLLTDGIPVFEGDATREQGEGANKKFATVIGVSGTLATEDFLKELTGDTVYSHNLDMFAGMMDTIAATAIADALNGKKPPFIIPERAGLIIRSH